MCNFFEILNNFNNFFQFFISGAASLIRGSQLAPMACSFVTDSWKDEEQIKTFRWLGWSGKFFVELSTQHLSLKTVCDILWQNSEDYVKFNIFLWFCDHIDYKMQYTNRKTFVITFIMPNALIVLLFKKKVFLERKLFHRVRIITTSYFSLWSDLVVEKDISSEN